MDAFAESLSSSMDQGTVVLDLEERSALEKHEWANNVVYSAGVILKCALGGGSRITEITLLLEAAQSAPQFWTALRTSILAEFEKRGLRASTCVNTMTNIRKILIGLYSQQAEQIKQFIVNKRSSVNAVTFAPLRKMPEDCNYRLAMGHLEQRIKLKTRQKSQRSVQQMLRIAHNIFTGVGAIDYL